MYLLLFLYLFGFFVYKTNEQSRKVTPDGIVPGAIIHNQTTNTIQVGLTSDTFRNLSPIVAFATISSGVIVANSSTGLSVSFNGSSVATFTLTPNLTSANYTVIVSNNMRAGGSESPANGTSTYTVSEANKSASGFTVEFAGGANADVQTYSVMVLQV